MDLFGVHQVSFEHVRRLALVCYALDAAAYPLFVEGTHDDKHRKTQATFEELFCSELLSLAIALRTKFYQGLDPAPSIGFISPSGLLYRFGKGGEVNEMFSVKDVCDKIIHARSIERTVEPAQPNLTTVLEGTSHSGEKWQLSLSVGLFIEGLLNWLASVGEA